MWARSLQACPLRRRPPPLANDLLQHLRLVADSCQETSLCRSRCKKNGPRLCSACFFMASGRSRLFFHAKVTLASAFSSFPFSCCPLHVAPPSSGPNPPFRAENLDLGHFRRVSSSPFLSGPVRACVHSGWHRNASSTAFAPSLTLDANSAPSGQPPDMQWIPQASRALLTTAIHCPGGQNSHTPSCAHCCSVSLGQGAHPSPGCGRSTR